MPDKFGKIEEPLDILVEYGYLDDPNIPYHRALNIAVNDFSNDQKLGGDENREILEILQKEARKELKLRRKKIDVSKFFGKKEKEKEKETDTTGTSDLAVRSKTGRIDTKKLIPEPTEEKGGALAEILTGVNSIVETLKATKKQDKKQQSFLQRMVERFKRRKKENKLEFKVFDGLKKTATKLLAPMKNAWNEFLGFIGKVILGRVLFKILEWMGDKENQGKLKSIIKFFEDWWPAMLAGYLLFGNSLTSMVTGMLIQMGKWLAPMLLAIGKLMLNPWVLAGMGALGSIYLIGKTLGKEKEGENIAESTNESREAIVDEGDMDEGEASVLSQSVTTENVDRMTQGDTNLRSDNNMLQTGYDDPLGGGRIGLNKGGTVPGSGNTDTVPAMLTPGEFVMSKGAVQKYGVDTLEGLNAAAGGTNKPTLMGGYKEGGFANITNTMTSSSSNSDGNFSVGKRYVAPGEAKERIAEMGMPSMELMDGTVVPDFGKMGGEKVTQGLQLTRDIMVQNGASPDRIAQLDEVIADPLAQPESISYMINKIVPGSMENTMMNVGDSITQSARMNGGGLVSNSISNFNSGGLVQAFQGGGLVQAFQGGGSVGFFGGMGNVMSGKTWGGQDRIKPQRGRGQGNKLRALPSKSSDPNIQPSEKKKVTVAYEEEKKKSDTKKNQNNSEQKIPNFNVTASRSPQKIKVLGISV